jgi:DNA relaxase NicK
LEVAGLDWLTVSAPSATVKELTEWGCRRFGAEWVEQGGFAWYGASRRWAGGLKLGVEQKGDGNTICVMLDGATLQKFAPAERVEILRELLELGCKPTRLDLALDAKGDHVELVERVIQACFDGKLCGARCWRPISQYGQGGKLEGRTVYIGKRGGDGSGRFLRVYDKGLESGEVAANQWQRMELETSGEVAVQVARGLVSAVDQVEFTAAVVMGAVSFREGVKRRMWTERVECAWWSEFKAGTVGVRYVAAPRFASLAGRVSWLRNQVAKSLLGMAEASGKSLRAVVNDVIGVVQLPAAVLQRCAESPAAIEYALSKGIATAGVAVGWCAPGKGVRGCCST